MGETVLIVDDEPVQRRLLEAAVTKMGHDCRLATGGEEALEILTESGRSPVAIVLLDLVMPDLDGISVLTRMRKAGCRQPVIVQTSQGGIDTAVNAMRAGASDFVVKPASPERLKVSIANALKIDALEGEVQRIKRKSGGSLTFGDMIADSPAMERVISLGKRAAGSNIPILLEGESGVGKEIMARAIQGTGARKSKPFVTVNCGAIPDNLVESILFGHEKGAFTGASDKHVGKFQEADGGTLFLDEVGELPPDVQVKLLRALQEGEIDPVGARRPVKVDIRLISATNKNLIDCVKEGVFREDLYYRLNVFPINVPPLRKRREDIPGLVRHLVSRIAVEEARQPITGIHRDALNLLSAFDWPGNVRQLENAIFRAIVLCDGPELTIDEFPQIAALRPDGAPDIDAGTVVPLGEHAVNPMPAACAIPAPSTNPSSRIPGVQPAHALLPALGDKGRVRSLAAVEEDMIRFAIDHHKGRMTSVAKSLGIGRSTLYRKLKEYGIDPDFERDAAE